MLMAEIKDLLCLGQIQGSPIGMVTGTVADRNQQLGADIGCKVQDPDPLFTGQDTAVTVAPFRRSPPSSQCCRTSGVCPHDGSDETDKQSKGCLFLDFDVHFSYLDTLPCLWAIDSFLNMPIQGCGQRNTQQRSRNPAQHDGRQHPDSRQPKGETDVRNIVIIKSAHFTGQSTACVTLFLISTVSVTFWDNPRRLSQNSQERILDKAPLPL